MKLGRNEEVDCRKALRFRVLQGLKYTEANDSNVVLVGQNCPHGTRAPAPLSILCQPPGKFDTLFVQMTGDTVVTHPTTVQAENQADNF